MFRPAELGSRNIGRARLTSVLLGFDAGAVEDADPDRAADAGAVGRAVPVRVLVEVLLVVVLGVIEGAGVLGRAGLSGDVSVAGLLQSGLVTRLVDS